MHGLVHIFENQKTSKGLGLKSKLHTFTNNALEFRV